MHLQSQRALKWVKYKQRSYIVAMLYCACLHRVTVIYESRMKEYAEV